jgi:hypothetical protein
MKEIFIGLKGEIDSFKIAIRYFNTLLSTIDIMTR